MKVRDTIVIRGFSYRLRDWSEASVEECAEMIALNAEVGSLLWHGGRVRAGSLKELLRRYYRAALPGISLETLATLSDDEFDAFHRTLAEKLAVMVTRA